MKTFSSYEPRFDSSPPLTKEELSYLKEEEYTLEDYFRELVTLSDILKELYA